MKNDDQKTKNLSSLNLPELSRREFIKRSSMLVSSSVLFSLPMGILASGESGPALPLQLIPLDVQLALGFNGERRDIILGIYHLGQGYRVYNPTLMQFQSADSLSPFGAGGINPYAFALGDPINLIDPTGHLSWAAWFGIGMGILGVVVGIATLGAGIVAGAGLISAGFAAGGAVGGLTAVASAGGVAAALTVASASVGIASAGLGIASSAYSDSDPQYSAKLAYASAITGYVSAGLGLGGNVAGRFKSGSNAHIVKGTITANGKEKVTLGVQLTNLKPTSTTRVIRKINQQLKDTDVNAISLYGPGAKTALGGSKYFAPGFAQKLANGTGKPISIMAAPGEHIAPKVATSGLFQKAHLMLTTSINIFDQTNMVAGLAGYDVTTNVANLAEINWSTA
ncbi:MAG: RHS repeat-associated core domain-containing protein [Algicola sp.]|nr:RHS repeat-associated core domain-containing protein [Algicola sp.]